MVIADLLVDIASRLGSTLDKINTALLSKGQSEATTLDEVSEKIDSIRVTESPSEILLQKKSITPTLEEQSVMPDSGYDGLSEVTILPVETTGLSAPIISISPDGLITAEVTQASGYVASGTSISEKSLPVITGQTITPGKTGTTLPSGSYTTGDVVITGDSNFVSDNIKKDVVIWGITGTYSGESEPGTNTDTSMWRSIFDKTIIEFVNSDLSTINSYAFYNCESLSIVDTYATLIKPNAFTGCSTLGNIMVNNKDALVLRSPTMCILEAQNAFTGTGYMDLLRGGFIWVPEDLISEYSTDPIWSSLINAQFMAIEGSPFDR